MKCRHCNTDLSHTFIDLGSSPPSNSYLTDEELNKPEKWYPLKVLVCSNCWLVQTEDFVGFNEMFSEDYAYFSSFSSSWLDHAKSYVEKMVERFNLNSESTVVEIAANDGYLLQYVKDSGIPCYGIEPTRSTAMAARQKGIDIIEEFFGNTLARKLVSNGKQADLIAANNVLAHVPDINDFVKGFVLLLKKNGVATFEFPHLMNLVEHNQFDTIYHEHFSYLSLTAVNTIFKANGLSIFDVEQLSTHGGSLRVFAQRVDTGQHASGNSVKQLLENEKASGVTEIGFYRDFQQKAENVKNELLKFLIKCKEDGKKVAAYGAAAKGNTLLNFSGIRKDLINFVVDKNPAKTGKFLPGSRIPIYDLTTLTRENPDYILILPWNLSIEITDQLAFLKESGGKFIVAVPSLKLI